MEIKNKKIFISGGCGFIGSALIQRLVLHNKLVVFDNYRRNALQYFTLPSKKNLNFIKGDILDLDLLKHSVKGCDIIIHLAAMAGVSSYYEFPVKTMEVNFLGTRNLLTVARQLHPELFLNFSTSEVYGPFADHVNENSLTSQGSPLDQRWTYSVSKLAAEHLAFAFMREYNIPVVSIRPFNIYGPGQVGEGAIQIFINKALKNDEISVTGNGKQIRAWCYIDGLVEGVLACIKNKNALGKTFNIGNPGASVTTIDLARKIIGLIKSKSKCNFVSHSGTDIMVRIPDIMMARRILQYRPKIDLTDGLSMAINWYRRIRR